MHTDPDHQQSSNSSHRPTFRLLTRDQPKPALDLQRGLIGAAIGRRSAGQSGMTAGAWVGIILLLMGAARVGLAVWYFNHPGHW